MLQKTAIEVCRGGCGRQGELVQGKCFINLCMLPVNLLIKITAKSTALKWGGEAFYTGKLLKMGGNNLCFMN